MSYLDDLAIFGTYTSLEEFLEEVERHEEIMFVYKDKGYAITYNDDKIAIYEAYNDETLREYNDIESLLNQFEVSGEKLADVILDVKQTSF